ncbi:double zinc ribbon domain-containing protein [Xinfangfangia pollutisoli]|uniref:double zinc ribbon domain-containing protein n=1 Tax=Xinfangfangia pollutisoli TaxID=2865960 RepID=UPI001CD3FB8C|nr:double zinc ribbon domain-containing protein [Xinfangfangia pollutisoli]
MQALIRAIYPPQCVSCDALTASEFGLCPACWRETPFITGLCCSKCGLPLPGDPAEAGVLCDDCLRIARPWAAGRAAMLYDGNARKMVLALKHGDRMELARPGGQWLLRAAQPLLRPGLLVVPVPLHRWRLWRRRYNQAALLSGALARLAGLEHCPDALIRARNTGSQEGRLRDDRFANVQQAFRAHPGRRARIAGRDLLLVDDVMTSGATFAAATEALHAAGARAVFVLALTRVAKGS